ASGKLSPPLMTIHFMWVPEYFGSEAYVTKHPEARTCNAGWNDPRTGSSANQPGACITVNLNLDMVGEDTVKTNSRFYITRTPDSVPGSLNGVWPTCSNKRATRTSTPPPALTITGRQR